MRCYRAVLGENIGPFLIIVVRPVHLMPSIPEGRIWLHARAAAAEC